MTLRQDYGQVLTQIYKSVCGIVSSSTETIPRVTQAIWVPEIICKVFIKKVITPLCPERYFSCPPIMVMSTLEDYFC